MSTSTRACQATRRVLRWRIEEAPCRGGSLQNKMNTQPRTKANKSNWLGPIVRGDEHSKYRVESLEPSPMFGEHMGTRLPWRTARQLLSARQVLPHPSELTG